MGYGSWEFKSPPPHHRTTNREDRKIFPVFCLFSPPLSPEGRCLFRKRGRSLPGVAPEGAEVLLSGCRRWGVQAGLLRDGCSPSCGLIGAFPIDENTRSREKAPTSGVPVSLPLKSVAKPAAVLKAGKGKGNGRGTPLPFRQGFRPFWGVDSRPIVLSRSSEGGPIGERRRL